MDGDAVRVMSWRDFVSSPGHLHSVFHKDNDHVTYDLQRVLDLTTSQSAENLGVGYSVSKSEIVLLVHNEAEMRELMTDLMRKLLLMRITVFHTEISSEQSVETISIREDELAVLVNTNHPSIRTRLGEGIKCAALRMSRCEKFCLELDMCRSLHDWYTEQQGAITRCDHIHQVKLRRARLYLTNHSIHSHIFDCKPHWWLCLCFCWLLAAPCYKMYRTLTCKDLHIEIQGEITSASVPSEDLTRLSKDPRKQGTNPLECQQSKGSVENNLRKI